MTGLINFIISSLVYFLAMRNGHIVSVPFMFFYEKSRNHTFIIYVVPAYVGLLFFCCDRFLVLGLTDLACGC